MKPKNKLIECRHTIAGFREAKQLPGGKRLYEVVILTEGKGNPRDKHYYSQACIDSPMTAAAFEGKPCYLNHPSTLEEEVQPERRVQDIGGYFESVHPDGNALKGTLRLTTTEAGEFLEAFIKDCLDYSIRYPGQNLGGISINARGDAVEAEMDGETWKKVDNITEAFSADAVTLPARGGMFMKQLEALRKEKVGEILASMRDKIEAGGDFPLKKDLARMVNNALTACGQSTESEGKMKKTGTKVIEVSKADKNAAYKHMAEFYGSKAKASEDEAEKKTFQAQAEKYKAMAGEGEGDLQIVHKDGDDAKDVTDQAEAEDEKDKKENDTTMHQAEDEDESEAGKKKEGEDEEESEDEDESESEAKKKESKKMESLRKENERISNELNSLKLEKKLTESGIPEVYHASIRLSAKGKTDKEMDAIIEARVNEYEFELKESGRVPAKAGSFKESGSHEKMTAVLEKHGLI